MTIHLSEFQIRVYRKPSIESYVKQKFEICISFLMINKVKTYGYKECNLNSVAASKNLQKSKVRERERERERVR